MSLGGIPKAKHFRAGGGDVIYQDLEDSKAGGKMNRGRHGV